MLTHLFICGFYLIHQALRSKRFNISMLEIDSLMIERFQVIFFVLFTPLLVEALLCLPPLFFLRFESPQNNRHSYIRIFLQSFDNIRGFVAIYSTQCTLMNSLGSSAKAIIKFESTQLIRRHFRHLFLNSFQNTNCCTVCLNYDIKFEPLIIASINKFLVLSFARSVKSGVL